MTEYPKPGQPPEALYPCKINEEMSEEGSILYYSSGELLWAGYENDLGSWGWYCQSCIDWEHNMRSSGVCLKDFLDQDKEAHDE